MPSSRKPKDDYKTTRILGNGYLSYSFLDGFNIKTQIAIDKGAETRNRYSPTTISTTGVATGLSSSVDNYSWTAEALLNYAKTFAGGHHVEALAGYSAQKFEQVSNSVSGTNFPSDDVEWISAATAISDGASNTTAYSLLSTIGRLNYSYKGRYLLSGSIRRDGASVFGKNRRWGNFPSVSVGWILSDEKFLEKIKYLNFLKIRASYGITGNNRIGGSDNYPLFPRTRLSIMY